MSSLSSPSPSRSHSPEGAGEAGGRSPSSNGTPNNDSRHRKVFVASIFLPFAVNVPSLPPNRNGNNVRSPFKPLSSSLFAKPKVNATATSNTRDLLLKQDNSQNPTQQQPLNNNDTKWTIEPAGFGNIGLHNAVNAVFPVPHGYSSSRNEQRVWVGSTFNPSQKYSTLKTNMPKKEDFDTILRSEYGCVPVWGITEESFDHSYHQFCKMVLWRLFHHQFLDATKNFAYDNTNWEHYKAVNQAFANTIAQEYQDGDIVWVNDYHLMLVPQMLRQLKPNAIIGFFLHIPFPSSEIFRCLHVRKEILLGLLGADLVGFQTYSYTRHFLMTTNRLLGYEASFKGVQMENKLVAVGSFPMGIDITSLNMKRSRPEVAHLVSVLQEKYAGKKLIIGRDKNDYIKGIRQKLLAFEMFLDQHPEWRGIAVLIQVALSTSEEAESASHLMDIISRINSKYMNIEYSPVVYLHQDIQFEHYLALLSVADLLVITSLRDGMNLTSHEYVVCQETKKSPLIISEFAGTTGTFASALRINPWDVREVADTMDYALRMGNEERDIRWTESVYQVTANSAQKFVTGFVDQLRSVCGEK